MGAGMDLGDLDSVGVDWEDVEREEDRRETMRVVVRVVVT